VIPINFHVDYWDSLGWADPFAKPEYSARQRRFKQLKQATTVGTPGFIVNGRGWDGWFLAKPLPSNARPDVGVITVHIVEQHMDITFKPTAPLDSQLDIHYAMLGFEQYTQIPRGENKGKNLRHDFVVMKHYQEQMIQSDDKYTHHATLSLPHSNTILSLKHGIAIWVTYQGQPTPIQVTGDWLTP